MATFLDVSILSNFISVFTMLLVFVIVFGVSEVMNLFGEGKKGLRAMVALAVSFIVLFSKGIMVVIQTFTPWFVLLVLVIFFMLFAVRMFGVGEKEIKAEIMKDSTITTWIIILVVTMVLFSLGTGLGQTSLEQTRSGGTESGSGGAITVNNQSAGSVSSSDFSQNLYNTIYHPKILGLILIMLIAVIAILFLTASES